MKILPHKQKHLRLSVVFFIHSEKQTHQLTTVHFQHASFNAEYKCFRHKLLVTRSFWTVMIIWSVLFVCLWRNLNLQYRHVNTFKLVESNLFFSSTFSQHHIDALCLGEWEQERMTKGGSLTTQRSSVTLHCIDWGWLILWIHLIKNLCSHEASSPVSIKISLLTVMIETHRLLTVEVVQQGSSCA